MSAANFILPSLKKSSICLSPKPSISKALRDEKCLRLSIACAGHTRRPVQRRTTSACRSSRRSRERGRAADRANELIVAVRRKGEFLPLSMCVVDDDVDDLRDHVAGALHDDRVADPHVLALDFVLVVQTGVETTTPPTVTGCNLATGVSAPVRPTWISIACTNVVAARRGICALSPSAGYAKRIPGVPARRGRRPCRRRRRYRSQGWRAGLRWNGNGQASPPRCCRSWSAD